MRGGKYFPAELIVGLGERRRERRRLGVLADIYIFIYLQVAK
jgi:hypothetical protein